MFSTWELNTQRAIKTMKAPKTLIISFFPAVLPATLWSSRGGSANGQQFHLSPVEFAFFYNFIAFPQMIRKANCTVEINSTFGAQRRRMTSTRFGNRIAWSHAAFFESGTTWEVNFPRQIFISSASKKHKQSRQSTWKNLFNCFSTTLDEVVLEFMKPRASNVVFTSLAFIPSSQQECGMFTQKNSSDDSRDITRTF